MATKATNRALLAAQTLAPLARTSQPLRLDQLVQLIPQIHSVLGRLALHLARLSHSPLDLDQVPPAVGYLAKSLRLLADYLALRHPNHPGGCLEVIPLEDLVLPEPIQLLAKILSHQALDCLGVAMLPSQHSALDPVHQLQVVQDLVLQPRLPEDLVLEGCSVTQVASKTPLHLASSNHSSNSSNNNKTTRLVALVATRSRPQHLSLDKTTSKSRRVDYSVAHLLARVLACLVTHSLLLTQVIHLVPLRRHRILAASLAPRRHRQPVQASSALQIPRRILEAQASLADLGAKTKIKANSHSRPVGSLAISTLTTSRRRRRCSPNQTSKVDPASLAILALSNKAEHCLAVLAAINNSSSSHSPRTPSSAGLRSLGARNRIS